jgi:hypothetical protein
LNGEKRLKLRQALCQLFAPRRIYALSDRRSQEGNSTMARSRRRTSIISITTSASEKQDKRHANRNCRSALRRALKCSQDPDVTVLSILCDVSDE